MWSTGQIMAMHKRLTATDAALMTDYLNEIESCAADGRHPWVANDYLKPEILRRMGYAHHTRPSRPYPT